MVDLFQTTSILRIYSEDVYSLLIDFLKSKIHPPHMDKKVVVKVPAGKLLKIFVSLENGVIQRIQITGDFFVYPEEAIIGLEHVLQGVSLQKDVLEQKIGAFVRMNNVQFFGITVEAIVGALLQCKVDDSHEEKT
jgi:lipoate---protein ligase